jgi:hypothetical protein
MLFVLEKVLLGGYSSRASSPSTAPKIGAVTIKDDIGNRLLEIGVKFGGL